ncbi:MAG: 6-pyruvoyl-tetrahydropterin synthase related domain [Frankiales bacterium]|nr:6-pyruvoyl-tetrahydropterin synthase related domain [Frankiales bacterium]
MHTSQPTDVLRAPRRVPRPAISVGPVARRRLAAWAPPVFVALLALPFILKQNIYWEWQVPYWMLERQTEHVAAHGTPTLFLHLKSGAFTPVYMFYGGPTLSLLAYPSVLLGPWTVYVASIVGAMVAGYLGIWWAARNLGLSHGLAVIPALTFATAPYLVAELYGRGAWAEQLGANAAAVVLGAVTAKIWKPTAHPRGTSAALVASGAVLAGTHNLSLMMAALLLPLIVLAVLPLAPWSRGILGIARSVGGAVVALAVGAGLTAAWLIPNIWFGPKTYISTTEVSSTVRDQQLQLTTSGNVLSPWLHMPEEMRGKNWLYVQSPILALAWAIVALAVVAWIRRRHPGRVLLSSAALLGLTTGLILVILENSWWPQFPRLIQTIQFSLRLIPYFVMVIALAVTVALISLPLGRARRVLVPLLMLFTAAQVGMGVWITHVSRAAANHPTPLLKAKDLHAGDEPVLVGGDQYIFPFQFRIVHHPAGARPAGPPAAVGLDDPAKSDAGTLAGTARVGDVLGAYISWSPFIRMDGDAEIAGYDDWGQAVIRIDRTDARGQWKATVRSRCTSCLGALAGKDPWQLLAGRALSVLSALIVVVTGGLWLRRWWRRSRVARRGAAGAR